MLETVHVSKGSVPLQVLMEWLDYLWSLFDLLLDTLPLPRPSDYSEFYLLDPFELEPNLLQQTNDNIPEAILQHLHTIFVTDGGIDITECGPIISSVVGVLKMYLQDFPRHPMFLKWQEHLIKSLEDVLEAHSITVCGY